MPEPTKADYDAVVADLRKRRFETEARAVEAVARREFNPKQAWEILRDKFGITGNEAQTVVAMVRANYFARDELEQVMSDTNMTDAEKLAEIVRRLG